MKLWWASSRDRSFFAVSPIERRENPLHGSYLSVGGIEIEGFSREDLANLVASRLSQALAVTGMLEEPLYAYHAAGDFFTIDIELKPLTVVPSV